MSRFYKDDYWGMWVRRLLVLDGQNGKRYFDISITARTGNDVSLVKEERIRIHRTADNDKMFVVALPEPVKLEMRLTLGADLTERLLSFNYIKELGLENILRADKANPETHGTPVSRIPLTTLWGQTL